MEIRGTDIKETVEASGATAGVDQKEERLERSRTRKKQRKLPLEPVTIYVREKKVPTKFDEYQLYSCTRSYYIRFNALEVVVSSGSLSCMDIDTARRVINAIMK